MVPQNTQPNPRVSYVTPEARGTSATLAATVLLAHMGLAHVRAGVQLWPQGTLDAFFFEGSSGKLEKSMSCWVLGVDRLRQLLSVPTKKLLVHLHEAPVGTRVCSHEVVVGRLGRQGLLFRLQLLQLLLHRHRPPPEADHIRVDSVAMLGPRRSPHVGFQRPQGP